SSVTTPRSRNRLVRSVFIPRLPLRTNQGISGIRLNRLRKNTTSNGCRWSGPVACPSFSTMADMQEKQRQETRTQRPARTGSESLLAVLKRQRNRGIDVQAL